MPYIKPTLPVLNTETTDTQYQLTQKIHEYDKAMLTYWESIDVDRILIQKIVNAIKATFLKALCNCTTNRITNEISEILNYLLDTYGDISPQEMASLWGQIEHMTFDPTEPVDEIFTEIDNYAEIANIVNDPISSTQKYKLAYIVLLNTK